MIIYHGSTDLVKEPEIRAGDTFLDFGAGFYTTTSYDQAERWARIKMRRENRDTGYVAVYEFDYDAAKKILSSANSKQRIWNGCCLWSTTGEAFLSQTR